MTARRDAILVRLLSPEQRRAIERGLVLVGGETLAARCRSVLLAYVGRPDLDRPVAPLSQRGRLGGDARGTCSTCGRRRAVGGVERVCVPCRSGL